MFETTHEVEFLSEHEAQRILDKMIDKTDAELSFYSCSIADCG